MALLSSLRLQWSISFVDLQNICLELKYEFVKCDGTNLDYQATDAIARDTPMFMNNVLTIFFSVYASANGVEICSINSIYLLWKHSFQQTEAKHTWLKFIGCLCDENLVTFKSQAFSDGETETRQSGTLSLIGKVAADISTCVKHLYSGVTLRVSFKNKARFFF